MMTKGSGNPQSFAIEWNKRGACFKAMAAVGLVQAIYTEWRGRDTLSSSRGIILLGPQYGPLAIQQLTWLLKTILR